jgi:hypothetical protein
VSRNFANMEGYQAIAQLMGNHDEMAIVRRFKDLNMQDILYLQAEIIHLKDELRKRELQDKKDPERVYLAKDWWSLAHSDDEEGRARWATVLEIREKLDEYSMFVG